MAAEALSGRGVEWNEVRALLAAETDTPMGRDRALGATPLLDPPAVSAALSETSQARLAVAAHGLPPWQAIPDVRPSLTRCRADGATVRAPSSAASGSGFETSSGASSETWTRCSRRPTPTGSSATAT